MERRGQRRVDSIALFVYKKTQFVREKESSHPGRFAMVDAGAHKEDAQELRLAAEEAVREAIARAAKTS